MEGLTLEVRADISLFEQAMSRLQRSSEISVNSFGGGLRGLEDLLAGTTLGFESLSEAFRSQEQAWTTGGASLMEFEAGLDQVGRFVERFGQKIAAVSATLSALSSALRGLPERVDVDVFINTHGLIPSFHQGGLIAGPPFTAHGGAYFSPPNPEERDVRVLSGEYVLSRLGVGTLGLDVLQAADQGRTVNGQSLNINQNHYHINVDVQGVSIDDPYVMDQLAEKVSEAIDYQQRGEKA